MVYSHKVWKVGRLKFTYSAQTKLKAKHDVTFTGSYDAITHFQKVNSYLIFYLYYFDQRRSNQNEI